MYEFASKRALVCTSYRHFERLDRTPDSLLGQDSRGSGRVCHLEGLGEPY